MMNEVLIYNIPDSWMNLGSKKKFYFYFLESIIAILLTFPILMMVVFAITKNILDLYKISILVPYLIAVIFLRCFIKRDIKYYLLIFALAFGVFYSIPNLLNKIFALSYYFIYIIESIKKRNQENISYYREGTLYLGYALFFAEYIVCGFIKMNAVQVFIIIDAIVVSLIFTIYLHIARTKKLMEWEKQTSKSAAQRINKASTNLIYYIIGITFALCFVFFFTGLFKPVNYSIKNNTTNKTYEDNKIQNKSKPQTDSPFKDMVDNSKTPSKFAKFLGKTLEIAINLILAFIFIALIIMLLKSLISKLREIFYHRKIDGEEKESVFNLEDIKDNILEKINNIKHINLSFGNTNNEKVRKAYYKFVYRYGKKFKKITQSDTPYSIEKKVNEDMNIDINAFTRIYETARYGRCDCSVEEVEAVKNLISKLKNK